MPKIMVVAGEVSGDLQAARVIQVLQKRIQNLTLIGMGGEEMRKVGVEILYDPTQLSTIGFIEAAKHLGQFFDLLKMLSKIIDKEKPDLLFLVDYSGFNMRMARIGQRKNVPIVNYFSPSAWVWGKWRARKMAETGAKIAAVFPMEEAVYRESGADVTFVGHPLLDFVKPTKTSEDFRQFLNLKPDTPIVGLLPGSRKGEIIAHLPPMLEGARLIREARSDLVFVLPIASIRLRDLILSIVDEDKGDQVPIYFTHGQSYEVMANSEVLLTASGTATLEAACLRAPMVILYRTSWSTYHLSKLLAKVQYVGLPNIIAGREIVPEFLQNEATGSNLARAALEVLNNPSQLQQIKTDLDQVRQALGASGAVERVADLIIKTLEEKNQARGK